VVLVRAAAMQFDEVFDEDESSDEEFDENESSDCETLPPSDDEAYETRSDEPDAELRLSLARLALGDNNGGGGPDVADLHYTHLPESICANMGVMRLLHVRSQPTLPAARRGDCRGCGWATLSNASWVDDRRRTTLRST
jgi:hypothetical protein